MLHELFITHCTNGSLIMNPFTHISLVKYLHVFTTMNIVVDVHAYRHSVYTLHTVLTQYYKAPLSYNSTQLHPSLVIYCKKIYTSTRKVKINN